MYIKVQIVSHLSSEFCVNVPVASPLFKILILFCLFMISEEEVNGLVVRVIQNSAEDSDDEVRLAALEFIHTHIRWTLNKSGK